MFYITLCRIKGCTINKKYSLHSSIYLSADDDNRVVLQIDPDQNDSHGDYINASYIDVSC